MSISQSLSNALSGMTAASRMAEVVSSNVSNAMTDGYGRRSLNLSAASIGDRGAGVKIDSVSRHSNPGLIADRRSATASQEYQSDLLSTMTDVEILVGQAGDPDSISNRIVAVEKSLTDAINDPSSEIRLGTLGNRLGDLTSSLNSASKEIQIKRAAADATIAEHVENLNKGLSQVERLNNDIARMKATGGDPSSLQDQRQQIVDNLSEIVPLRELERDGGKIALMSTDGAVLLDKDAAEYEFTRSPVIVPNMTLSGGALSGLSQEGVSLGTNGFGRLSGGTLAAAFHARDKVLTEAQEGLDQIAADLATRFQDPSIDSTRLPGQPGLLTDNGSVFNDLNMKGFAGRIAVNAAVDPVHGGHISRLRDGLNAASAGLSGDSSLLQSLSAALSNPTTTSSDPVEKSAAGRASDFMTRIGRDRVEVESELSFANARVAILKEAESAEGVDTDYEMQMLLRVEQAYAANARVIQTVDRLMQKLMEI